MTDDDKPKVKQFTPGEPLELNQKMTEPAGMEPAGMEPAGMEPDGMEPDGMEPDGMEPDGMEPDPIVPVNPLEEMQLRSEPDDEDEIVVEDFTVGTFLRAYSEYLKVQKRRRTFGSNIIPPDIDVLIKEFCDANGLEHCQENWRGKLKMPKKSWRGQGR